MNSVAGHRISDSLSDLQDHKIHGYAHLHEGARGIVYNPVSRYSFRENADLKYAHKAKDNWYKNGDCDNIPYIHRQMYRDSGLHKSIVDAKSNMLFGGGFDLVCPNELCVRDEDGFYDFIELGLTDSQKEAAIKEGRRLVCNTGMERYYMNACQQIATYGGYYGVRFYDLNALENRVFVRHLICEKYYNVRLGSNRKFINSHFESDYHYIAKDFTNISQSRKVMNYKDYLEKGIGKRTAIGKLKVDDGSVYRTKKIGAYGKHFAKLTDVRDHYATPDYESRKMLNYLCVDYILSEHDKRDISNGLSLNHIIVRYRKAHSDPEIERQQKEADLREVRENYKGALGARSSMIWAEHSFDSNNKIESPEPIKVIEIPHNNNQGRYNALREERTLAILNAHGITASEIVGVPSSTGKGFASQKDFLVASIEHLYWNRIAPFHKMLEEDLNEIFMLESLPLVIKPKKSLPTFKSVSDKILKCAYTINEIREKFGDQPLREEDLQDVAEIALKKINESDNNDNNGV